MEISVIKTRHLCFQRQDVVTLGPGSLKLSIRTKLCWTSASQTMVHTEKLDTFEVPHSRSTRPQYSTAQPHAYFSLTALPPVFLSSPIQAEPMLARTSTHRLPFLSALIQHHIALHYSPYRNATPVDAMLDMQKIYSLVVEGGMGCGGQ